jgi:hypothetical protein
MGELDQGSLHPSIKHPETDMSRLLFEPTTSTDGDSTKELSRQLTLLLFGTSSLFNRKACALFTADPALTCKCQIIHIFVKRLIAIVIKPSPWDTVLTYFLLYYTYVHVMCPSISKYALYIYFSIARNNIKT